MFLITRFLNWVKKENKWENNLFLVLEHFLVYYLDIYMRKKEL